MCPRKNSWTRCAPDEVAPLPAAAGRGTEGDARHPPLRLCENRRTDHEPDEPLLQAYFKNLYRRTMDEAYGLAFDRVA